MKIEELLRQADAERRSNTAGSAAADGGGGAPSSASSEENVGKALSKLSDVLRKVIPILQRERPTRQPAAAASAGGLETKGGEVVINAAWLVEVCQNHVAIQRASGDAPSPPLDDPLFLAETVVSASKLGDPASQQGALFDALGASPSSLELLTTVTPLLSDIRRKIDAKDLLERNQERQGGRSQQTADEQRRQRLLNDAMDAAHVAAVAQAEVDNLRSGGGIGGATHTLVRKSDLKAEKEAQKAAERARKAMERAREAGVVLDGDADSYMMMASSSSADPASMQFGAGGLMNKSGEEIAAMVSRDLLPEGTRHHYDDRGLPAGTIQETDRDGTQRILIPAATPDTVNMHPRLRIDDVLDGEDAARAFSGTSSLNPLQSAVFEVAHRSRVNMLVCAPTGAGKTNVAMLATTAHFRDVGLIGGGGGSGDYYEDSNNNNNNESSTTDTGPKVVYIAPMKALAQEVVEKFSSKLKPLGLVVKELTGDMQLTRAQADAADVLVTTPEKWDVVTRKSGTDETTLGAQCGLLIIDEVHLLADERGAVIESVVARVHRFVEARQRQVRIVALSATLPNYDDVAEFLHVPPRGLFYFGPEFRPVPLQQQFIGVKVAAKDRNAKEKRLNETCFDIVIKALREGHQVMVFVHSRKGTGDTARALADIASNEGVLEQYFSTQGREGAIGDAFTRYASRAQKSRNREVGQHFLNGMGIHHAGMLRGDRKLTEQMFADGAIRVLCCTATLAWGVNLPAHSIVIKGTEVYNPEKGGMVDLSILDVQQIFGRAGRPQFDTSGEATMITTLDALPRYRDKLVRAVPIESNFVKQLMDHLNAEIVGRTATNIQEAARWLTYTYLYVRMCRNPIGYGVSADQKADDPSLRVRCTELVIEAAKALDSCQMVRYDRSSGNLSATENGRIAAHFYIQSESISTFNEMLQFRTHPDDADLLRAIASSTEFKNMRLRQEEGEDLEKILGDGKICPFDIKGTGADDEGRRLITDHVDKAFVLMQAFISRAVIRSFTLVSDVNYIASNAGRIARGLFEICLKRNMADSAIRLLKLAKSIDRQVWFFQTPLRQFEKELGENVLKAIEDNSRGPNAFDVAISLLDMHPKEVGQLCRSAKDGQKIQRLIRFIPRLDLVCNIQPVTHDVLKFHVSITPIFKWDGRWHGGAEQFWFWVEDVDSSEIYHHERLVITKRTQSDTAVLEFFLPTFGKSSGQYALRTLSDTWVGVDQVFPISFDESVRIPKIETNVTSLQNLSPLPPTALQEPKYEQLYKKFAAFNPIQTQLFHVLYHTDMPVLLGAPTGSGKTIVAEIAILRMKRIHPKGVCVYIAPLKALARERLKEWQKRLGSPPLGWKVLELSGDTHHNQSALEQADILVCTPEKWDLISRGWRGFEEDGTVKTGKGFIKRVKLLVLDEVHMLGEERGAVLEAIVSRTRFISRYVEKEKNESAGTRIVGLSTALANAIDLADWIGIDTKGHGPRAWQGLFNFRNSVRPVSIRIHIQGYGGRHYCPRMATMNKPCLAAINEYSPAKPVLIFVASRRQTRLTAFDLISYAASSDNPRQFLKCSDVYIEAISQAIRDEALRHTITFGIGLHHAGLSSRDRETVEKLYLNGEIQVVVATATLAWGVNLPAHLVIVKGTEYYDGKTSRYVDYPLTDVLQMIGRAGRPGFDDSAEAVIMCTEEKKPFYKRFLNNSFPVESCLHERICENMNAEVASGTVSSLEEAVGYLTWTFLSRRVRGNPSYYGAKSSSDEDVEGFLITFAKDALRKLSEHCCIEYSDGSDDQSISPLPLGLAASNFYLLHSTPKQMQFGVREARKITVETLANTKKENEQSTESKTLFPLERPHRVDEVSAAWLLYTLCSTHEFDEHPVRHNEEFLNQELSELLMWGPDTSSVLSPKSGGTSSNHNIEIFQDPHTKAFLLIQAYVERVQLPISDYVNDTKTIIENVPRLLAAMNYIARDDKGSSGCFELLTQFSRTRQIFETRSLADQDPLLQLPGVTQETVKRLTNHLQNKKGQTKQKKSSNSTSLSLLRTLPRKDASSTLEKFMDNRKKSRVDVAVETLYAMPSIELLSCSVQHEVRKATGESIGKLKLECEIMRDKPTKRSAPSSGPITLTILLGSYQNRMLLANASVAISRFGRWNLTKELDFDWNAANADGGVDGGRIVVRLLLEEVRGMDSEMIVGLQ